MIISGYQGIGKSTLASMYNKIIDLESSCFWKVEGSQKTRHPDWYVYYCQMAMHLSRQGYCVFVSCHKEVRDFLASHCDSNEFKVVVPSLSIKEPWIQRLLDRYEMSQEEKDERAYAFARDYYTSSISDVIDNTGEDYVYQIYDIDYKLEDIVDCLINK